MIDQIAQGAILFCGVMTVYLTTSLDPKHRRIASPIGLAAQPFWFYSSVQQEAWGVLFLSMLYAARWMQVFYRDWIRKR